MKTAPVVPHAITITVSSPSRNTARDMCALCKAKYTAKASDGFPLCLACRL